MGTAIEMGAPKGEWRGVARWFRLDPPLKKINYSWSDEPDEEVFYEYVIVSAANVMFSGPEAYIFPANDEGEVQSWLELHGSTKGTLSHEQALAAAGYEVVK